MVRHIMIILCLACLGGCQTSNEHNQLTGATWMGYGMGVTEYTGKLTR